MRPRETGDSRSGRGDERDARRGPGSAPSRGWEAAALALAAGMILLVGVEVGSSLWAERGIQWWVLGGLVVALILVSVGAGVVSVRLQRRHHKAAELAYTDQLTGLPNRRLVDLFLAKAFAAAQRGESLSVAMVDVDRFAALNTERGHAAGDDVLRGVAEVLARNTRAMNVSGRLDGAEFLALLPGVDAAGASAFGERVRAAVSELGARAGVELSVSVGIAVHDASLDGPAELLGAAEWALSRARSQGGDRVVVRDGRSRVEV